MQKTMNKTFFMILGLIIVGLIYLLEPILMPFLAGTLLAYLTNPIVDKMTKLHVPRILSVIIVFLCLFSILILGILLLIPLIHTQIEAIVAVIPSAVAWMQKNILPWLNANFGIDETINLDTIKATITQNWAKAGGMANTVLKTVLQSSVSMIEGFMNLVLIPVVTFYLLRDWNLVLKNIRSLLPRNIEPTVVKLAREGDSVLSEFLRGQLLVMISLGVIYSIGLTIIGLKAGIIIGMIAGLLCIVPYLGFIVGIVSASVAAYLQFGAVSSIGLVCLVFAIGQAIESTVLTPKLVGHRIGLHPVAVIFAVLAGGSLFGFFGVLLALPVAAVIMVLLRFLTQRYRHSRLYQE